jgi:hypothetical protein
VASRSAYWGAGEGSEDIFLISHIYCVLVTNLMHVQLIIASTLVLGPRTTFLLISTIPHVVPGNVLLQL